MHRSVAFHRAAWAARELAHLGLVKLHGSFVSPAVLLFLPTDAYDAARAWSHVDEDHALQLVLMILRLCANLQFLRAIDGTLRVEQVGIPCTCAC